MWIYICSTEGCAPLGWGDLGGRWLLWELIQCMPLGGQVHDLESFKQLFGKNLLVLKCHPSHDVDFNGELPVKVACKLHLKARDRADPSGFCCVTEHGADTVQQPRGCSLGAGDRVLLTHLSGLGTVTPAGRSGSWAWALRLHQHLLWVDAQASIGTGWLWGLCCGADPPPPSMVCADVGLR